MRKLIGLFLIVAAVCLTACKEQDETIEVNYATPSAHDTWDESDEYASIFGPIQEDGGPVVPFDFNTDLDMDLSMWRDMTYDPDLDNSVATVITSIVSLVIAFAADGCSIARKVWENKYRTRLNEVLQKCREINNSINNLSKSLNTLQHNLDNHIQNTMLLMDEMDYQMQLLDQQKRLTFIMDAILKKNGTMMEFIDGDFINYAEAFRMMDDYMKDSLGVYDNPMKNREYHQRLYGMLNDWAGDGNKRLMDVFALGNNLCDICYVTRQGTLVGMPALYDQLTFEIKAWEHEGVENRGRLRLMDLMVWMQCEQIVSGYLVACQTLGVQAHGVDPYELEVSFNQLCRKVAAMYGNIPVHSKFRICQVAGAHMVFVDTVIQEINYDTHRWYPVPLNTALDEEKMVFDFLSMGTYRTRQEQMPAIKAKRLLDFYHNPKYTMVDSILVKHGDMSVKAAPGSLRTGERRLLLNADPSSVKRDGKTWSGFPVYTLQASTAYTQVTSLQDFTSPVLYYCKNDSGAYVEPYLTNGKQAYNERVNNRIYYIAVR